MNEVKFYKVEGKSAVFLPLEIRGHYVGLSRGNTGEKEVPAICFGFSKDQADMIQPIIEVLEKQDCQPDVFFSVGNNVQVRVVFRLPNVPQDKLYKFLAREFEQDPELLVINGALEVPKKIWCSFLNQRAQVGKFDICLTNGAAGPGELDPIWQTQLSDRPTCVNPGDLNEAVLYGGLDQ